MRCSDCGVNQGGKCRVYDPARGWRTLRLCEPCGQDRIADGHTIEDYESSWEREQDRRADIALSER